MKRKNEHPNTIRWLKICLSCLIGGLLIIAIGLEIYYLTIHDVALSLEPIPPPSSELIDEDWRGSSGGNLIHKIYCAIDRPRDVMGYMEQLDLNFRYQGAFDYYVSEITSTNLLFYHLMSPPQLSVTIYRQETATCPDGTRYDIHLYWESL